MCSDRTPAPTTGGTSYTGKGKTGVLSFARKQLGVGQSGDVTFHTAANGAPSVGFVKFRAPRWTAAADKPTQVRIALHFTGMELARIEGRARASVRIPHIRSSVVLWVGFSERGAMRGVRGVAPMLDRHWGLRMEGSHRG